MREVSSTAYCGPPVTTHFERSSVQPGATHSRQCLDLRPSARFTWLPKKSFSLSIGLDRQHILGLNGRPEPSPVLVFWLPEVTPLMTQGLGEPKVVFPYLRPVVSVSPN